MAVVAAKEPPASPPLCASVSSMVFAKACMTLLLPRRVPRTWRRRAGARGTESVGVSGIRWVSAESAETSRHGGCLRISPGHGVGEGAGWRFGEGGCLRILLCGYSGGLGELFATIEDTEDTEGEGRSQGDGISGCLRNPMGVCGIRGNFAAWWVSAHFPCHGVGEGAGSRVGEGGCPRIRPRIPDRPGIAGEGWVSAN